MRLTTIALSVLLAPFFPAAATAQAPAGGPEVVEVTPASRQVEQRSYVKVVKVPGPPVRTVPGAYEGTRQFQSWQWFSRGGYAQDRARAATRLQRYQPVPNYFSARFTPYSYWGGTFQPVTRTWAPVFQGGVRRW